jgi:hypothetical protein
VQLEHKWKEYVDVNTWYAYLVDDRGRRFEPVEVDRSHDRHIVEMWDREQRTARRNAAGDIVAIEDDAHLHRQTMGSLSVFRGKGDFVFYAEGLFTPEVRSLTLVLTRSGLEFRFTWDFAAAGLVAEAAAPG